MSTIYTQVKYDIEHDLVGTRWSNDSLRAHLSDRYNIKELYDVNESGLVSDYAFTASLDYNGMYVDIYYLTIPYDKDNSGNTLYITEVNIEKE